MDSSLSSIPVWRRYVIAVAALLLGAAVAAAVRPEWFVASTGRIPLLGGPLGAALLSVGLWLGFRLVYVVTLAAAALWINVAYERYHDGAVGIPEAQLTLMLVMSAVVGLLLVPPAMRRAFLARAA